LIWILSFTVVGLVYFRTDYYFCSWKFKCFLAFVKLKMMLAGQSTVSIGTFQQELELHMCN